MKYLVILHQTGVFRIVRRKKVANNAEVELFNR